MAACRDYTHAHLKVANVATNKLALIFENFKTWQLLKLATFKILGYIYNFYLPVKSKFLQAQDLDNFCTNQ